MTKHARRPAAAPPDPRWIAFGKRITDLRRSKGWLAYEVAKMIEVDPATISQLENGRRATGPERTTLVRLAELYGVPAESLLSLTGTPRSDNNTHHVTPRTASGSDTATFDRDQIRAAVYDALVALIVDIAETVGESRALEAKDAAGEDRGRALAPPRKRHHSA